MRQHQLDAFFDAPGVLFVELVLQTPQFFEGSTLLTLDPEPVERVEQRRCRGLGDLDGRPVIARDELAQVAQAFGHDLEDRALGRKGPILDILNQPGEAQARFGPHRSGVGRLLAAEDPQQRRLAGTVPANNRDALPTIDLQDGLVEQREMAKGHRHTVEDNERQRRQRATADYDRGTMARVEPEALENQDLTPVFLATKLKEAQRVEHALTDVSYVVEVEAYSRSLFGTLRYGATFYVIAGQAEYCRSRLVAAGLHRGVIDEPGEGAERRPTRKDL